MANSNAVTADKNAVKAGEKPLEKRRALGRGLDSLLPGPRAVSPAPAANGSQGGDASSTAASSSGASSSLGAPSSSSGADAGLAGPALPTLVGEIRASGETPGGEFVYAMPLDLVDLNPYQTRKVFSEEALQELADSIRVQGLIQPIVVRPGKEDGRFTLILGERRLRASRMAEMETIPVIVKRVSEQQAAEMTVVENLQRQDLICLEQAIAFANLSQQFHLTQEEIGKRVGLSRGVVSNYMRLLGLPSGVQEALWGGKMSYSHARLLSRLTDDIQIWSLAKRVMEEKMSVDQLEAVMIGVPKPGKEQNKSAARWVDPNVKAAQRSLEEILGMRVRIRDRQGRGRILIDYSTIEDFDRVVGMLGGK
jgi:ParB family transcriptional regulator, chromosome partitioning protein